MKKLNLALFFVALFSVVLFSSFTNSNKGNGINSNNGNGNIVTIDNGQTWIWMADNCTAAYVPSTSVRVQTATNGFLNITLSFQLPEGHCDIPATGATVTHYGDDSWAIVNSNGKVTAKIIYRPNDN